MCLTVVEAKKSKVKAEADWVLGEAEFPGSCMDIFSLSPHMGNERGDLCFKAPALFCLSKGLTS